jgi:hypothetical protein
MNSRKSLRNGSISGSMYATDQHVVKLRSGLPPVQVAAQATHLRPEGRRGFGPTTYFIPRTRLQSDPDDSGVRSA